MKKIFFSSIFSLIICFSLDAMTPKLLFNLLKTNSLRLSPLQSLYFSKGKEVFLSDLAKGVVPAKDIQSVARIFTQKSYVQPETCIQLFSERVDSMDQIRNAIATQPGYAPIVKALDDELVQDSFEFAQTAIDIDPSVVRAVVDRVPSVLQKPGLYWHGYGTREGTLLDYVEDEIQESLDSDRLDKLEIVKKDLLERDAKRLRELHAQALS